jgi:hypothetical protein
MVRTLRITSIISAILAVCLLILVVVAGGRSDSEIEEYLARPSIIEEFRSASREASGTDEVPPLVRQAQAFALYLNPPAPKVSKPLNAAGMVPSRPIPPKVSPKFTLVGTSYFPARPELSLALVDIPGKGLRWMRQSAKVGHLVIGQVHDGAILVRDNTEEYEMVPKRPEKRSLLKKENGGAQPAAEPAAVIQPAPAPARPAAPVLSTEQRQEAAKKMMQEVLGTLEAMKMGQEEASRLDELGKTLQNSLLGQDEPAGGSGKISSAE